jgi:hypothetical protein
MSPTEFEKMLALLNGYHDQLAASNGADAAL